MSARPRKRSLTLSGHRTSVSLEDAFWEEFRRLAAVHGTSVNALAGEIDAARGLGGGLDSGLAAAIRVWVLSEVKAGR